ncbi:Response regulator consisting of a CheY-like receiver domain and a winged-helix DNA-binding domain [Hahella chejuensis KCTC 2396]|uniref:Response regulator consisting of a CheY-like receiver domain and a winged-helix DNA-binding domain n=1 Tax=Hahella chejuensis (strain KCTC 2396) TaxID=349521 RepID=Q2SEU6_HAHCH|nr:response regulator [Hahella chejuensis]ABC30828.1 Response regulator consisting of a CheY-like receiver domain and a winged-helix DNA-binding domain [Hahella chejuensis KCTC 2396]
MPRVLLVEDDEKLSSLICKYLQQNGFETEVVCDGGLAVDAILASQPEIVILDLMLPGKDGLTICREIRAHYHGRILFLTASEDDMDHVAGVELGADDFVVKPIQARVLLARLRMLLRRSEISGAVEPHERSHLSSGNTMTFGRLVLHLPKRAATFGGESVALTTGEFDVLWLLASHAEEVVSRDYLYKNLRGLDYDGLDRTIDGKIATLRKKLGDNASLSTRIITVRGQGYLFVPDSWD